MMSTRLRQHRQRQHRGKGRLILVPFIDMLVILVVFLLLHTSDTDILPNTRNITIPQSVSNLKPHETLVVTVSPDSIYVGGQLVGSLAELATGEGNIMEPLRAALLGQGARVLGGATPQPAEVTIMGDRSVPYSVLKKVMATCTSADFGKVSLAVLEREAAQPLDAA